MSNATITRLQTIALTSQEIFLMLFKITNRWVDKNLTTIIFFKKFLNNEYQTYLKFQEWEKAGKYFINNNYPKILVGAFIKLFEAFCKTHWLILTARSSFYRLTILKLQTYIDNISFLFTDVLTIPECTSVSQIPPPCQTIPQLTKIIPPPPVINTKNPDALFQGNGLLTEAGKNFYRVTQLVEIKLPDIPQDVDKINYKTSVVHDAFSDWPVYKMGQSQPNVPDSKLLYRKAVEEEVNLNSNTHDNLRDYFKSTLFAKDLTILQYHKSSTKFLSSMGSLEFPLSLGHVDNLFDSIEKSISSILESLDDFELDDYETFNSNYYIGKYCYPLFEFMIPGLIYFMSEKYSPDKIWSGIEKLCLKQSNLPIWEALIVAKNGVTNDLHYLQTRFYFKWHHETNIKMIKYFYQLVTERFFDGSKIKTD